MAWIPLFTTILFTNLVKSLPWNGPAPTLLEAHNAQSGWTPAPTDAPRIGSLHYDSLLLPRQLGFHTCGYIDGDAAAALTCGTPYCTDQLNCYAGVCATDIQNSRAGCCDPGNIANCRLPTTCYPKTVASTACTGGCVFNPEVLRCTFESYTVCNTYSYIFDIMTLSEFHCGTAPGDVSVFPTTSGQAPISNFNFASIPPQAPWVTKTYATSFPTPSYISTAGASNSHIRGLIGYIVGGIVGIVIVSYAIMITCTWCFVPPRKRNPNEPESRFRKGCRHTCAKLDSLIPRRKKNQLQDDVALIGPVVPLQAVSRPDDAPPPYEGGSHAFEAREAQVVADTVQTEPEKSTLLLDDKK